MAEPLRPYVDTKVRSVVVTANIEVTAEAEVIDGDDGKATRDAYMAVLDQIIAVRSPVLTEEELDA